MGKKAVNIMIGIDCEGMKDVLGVWMSEVESSKFWLSVLTEVKNRGVKDIFIACVDGLTGFSDAINTVFPQTEVQRCIVHQIRNCCKFVKSCQPPLHRAGVCAMLQMVVKSQRVLQNVADLLRFSFLFISPSIFRFHFK